ncbi:LOW QUALITY PROTEIN: fibroblast growth factor 23-like [Pristis pectinata]|uniref:LOW QUALITY PROTEIN: fibroblast growth factor 23-like n=1 Tax=Pristis pectinata TaxID=685728 RepID=UPI00223E4EFE|nr:LOW QUALITY PROTEIN: fibroblast growth factor 23-like [Pristis pectinata]
MSLGLMDHFALWSAVRRLCAVLALIPLHFAMLGVSAPAPDAGPHVNSGWDQTIRFMHLYTAQAKGSFLSYHLQINDDGTVDGSRERSSHSLLEMRSVAPGVVAIKGYRSGRYLCMERNGRLLGSLSYNEGDCSFEERLLSGTYNVYWSEKYGAARVSEQQETPGPRFGGGRCPLSLSSCHTEHSPSSLDPDDESGKWMNTPLHLFKRIAWTPLTSHTKPHEHLSLTFILCLPESCLFWFDCLVFAPQSGHHASPFQSPLTPFRIVT